MNRNSVSYDRGMIKWLPFNSVVPLKEIKNKIKSEKDVTTFPILSDEELNTIQDNMLTAYHLQEEVIITYFYNYNLYKLKGIINLIIPEKKLIIVNKNIKLYFNQIVKINLI